MKTDGYETAEGALEEALRLSHHADVLEDISERMGAGGLYSFEEEKRDFEKRLEKAQSDYKWAEDILTMAATPEFSEPHRTEWMKRVKNENALEGGESFEEFRFSNRDAFNYLSNVKERFESIVEEVEEEYSLNFSDYYSSSNGAVIIEENVEETVENLWKS